MHNRLLSQSSILGLSFAAIVLAATLPAHADPTKPNEKEAASSASTAEETEKPKQATVLTMRNVTLPSDMMEDVQDRVNGPLMLTSSALFAAGYVPALITTLANSKATSGWLGVPVVGPWVDWGPNTSPGNKTLLFASGLLQAAGVAGIVSSFFVPESRTDKMPLMGKRRFNVGPVAGRGNYALSASGTF